MFQFVNKNKFNTFMAIAAHTNKSKNITAKDLNKIFRIDFETIKRTLEIIIQNCFYTENIIFSRTILINNKILKYKRIKDYFFINIFFATTESDKSTRGNICIQFFVTDKNFVYIVSIKNRKKFFKLLNNLPKKLEHLIL